MSWRVKLPVIHLEDGGDALLVYARAHNPPDGFATTQVFFKNGAYRSIEMALSKVSHVAKFGPFVTLVEGSEGAAAGVGLLGANGQPL